MVLGLGLGMNLKKTTSLILFAVITFGLTSCMEEPKKKTETVTSNEQFDKVIDSMIGEGSINPSGISVGDEDTVVQTITVSNSLSRELSRRKLKVVSHLCKQAEGDNPEDCSKNPKQREIKFSVEVIQRDNNGNPVPPVTELRTLVLKINDQGFYEFFGDPVKDNTRFAWDDILDLRGFCQSFETDVYKVKVTCTNLKLESELWGMTSIPVRKLGLNRNVVLTNKKTNEVIESQLRFTIRVSPEQKEISKIVSFCSEGLQKFENQIFYLVRCNNVEGL